MFINDDLFYFVYFLVLLPVNSCFVIFSRFIFFSTSFHLYIQSNILYLASVLLSGKSIRSWCDGSSDRSFMGWTH